MIKINISKPLTLPFRNQYKTFCSWRVSNRPNIVLIIKGQPHHHSASDTIWILNLSIMRLVLLCRASMTRRGTDGSKLRSLYHSSQRGWKFKVSWAYRTSSAKACLNVSHVRTFSAREPRPSATTIWAVRAFSSSCRTDHSSEPVRPKNTVWSRVVSSKI